MRASLILSVLVLAIGIAIGLIIQGERDTPPSISDQSSRPATTISGSLTGPDSEGPSSAGSGMEIRLRQLQQQLQNEVIARQELERKFEKLNNQLAASGKTGSVRQDSAVSTSPGTMVNSDEDTVWFNEQALLDAGLERTEANQLKVYFEKLEMDRLIARDQAARENWDNAELRAAMQEIADREQELKNRLGDQAYDAYLYASGQPNRVEVTSVLSSSPAANAGIQAGDYLLRYDNQRIYDWSDLRQATSGGDIDETVLVEVERNKKLLQFYLPRGPLGIRMNSVSTAP